MRRSVAVIERIDDEVDPAALFGVVAGVVARFGEPHLLAAALRVERIHPVGQ